MRMLDRAVRPAVENALRTFRVVSITGPRQSGKTTLARRIGEQGGRTFVTLDDLIALDGARNDPRGFLRGLKLPVTIDEIQRAPDLLFEIKRMVDRDGSRGGFLLTGSSDPMTAGRLRDSLAGRLAMIPLRPLSLAERERCPDWNPLAWIEEVENVRDLTVRLGGRACRPIDLAAHVLSGGFPEPALHLPAESRVLWFEQYTKTYLERDVPTLVRAGDQTTFLRFVRLAAAGTAQITNRSRLAGDLGVSGDTIRRWLGVAERSYVCETLPPYWRNVRKRLRKSAKLHFVDTGLAASLIGLRDWQQAREFNFAGALTETWIHNQIQVFRSARVGTPDLRFYRSARGEECDFVLEGKQSIPIEVKSSETPTARDAAGVRSFLSTFPRQSRWGMVLYPGSEMVPLVAGVLAVPMRLFLRGPD